jgi:hypothetical protein
MRTDVLRTSSRSLIKNHQLQATGCETTLPTWLTTRNPGGHKKKAGKWMFIPLIFPENFRFPPFCRSNHHMFGATWSLTRPWPADWQPFTLHLTSRRWQPRGRLAGGDGKKNWNQRYLKEKHEVVNYVNKRAQ